METKMFYDKAGNEYTIAPLGQDKILEVVRGLKKRGIVVTSIDNEFEKGLEFQISLAQAVLVGLKLKSETGDMKELSGTERNTFVLRSPGATAWITGKAGKLAAEASANFEDELGN